MDTKYLLSFLVIFLIVFLGDLLFVVRPAILKITGNKKSKKTKKKEKPLMEIEYLCNKFKLNRNKLNYNEFMFTFPLINSFIITIVTLILELIRIPFIFRLLIGFVLLLGLIYAIYETFAKYSS